MVVDGMIVDHPVRKVYPPDITAAIFWLKNRDPRKWRDVHRLDVETRVLRSADEIRHELLSELKDLYDKGLLSLPAPSKSNGPQ
jgi:hypothetical protein